MDTIKGHILYIDGAHGMLPLPQNTISALNRISSEPGLLKIPCGPWHLGRARAWARGKGLKTPLATRSFRCRGVLRFGVLYSLADTALMLEKARKPKEKHRFQ